MKIGWKFALLLLVVIMFIFTGCDNKQITDAKHSQDLNNEEMPRFVKTRAGYNCYGWAVDYALNWSHEFQPTLTSIPTPRFETCGKSEAKIIEWRDDHSAYIKDNSATIEVSEYILYPPPPDVRGAFVRYYSSPYNNNHGYDWPEAGPLKCWWKIYVPPPPPPPDPLMVYIFGPSDLEAGEWGEFEAYATDGYTPYTNYKWWYRLEEERGREKGGKPRRPPVGEWLYLQDFEGEDTIEFREYVDFSLKCRAYDSAEPDPQTAEKTFYVNVSGGW